MSQGWPCFRYGPIKRTWLTGFLLPKSRPIRKIPGKWALAGDAAAPETVQSELIAMPVYSVDATIDYGGVLW
jgi:hypothetical protein